MSSLRYPPELIERLSVVMAERALERWLREADEAGTLAAAQADQEGDREEPQRDGHIVEEYVRCARET